MVNPSPNYHRVSGAPLLKVQSGRFSGNILSDSTCESRITTSTTGYSPSKIHIHTCLSALGHCRNILANMKVSIYVNISLIKTRKMIYAEVIISCLHRVDC